MITESLSIISTQLYLCKSHSCAFLCLLACAVRAESERQLAFLYPTSEQKSAPIKCALQSVLIPLITGIIVVVNIV